jgi:hypothetical protein
MRRVGSTESRANTAWLTGLVSTMDAVTRAGHCLPIDPALRDRVAAHLRQPKPVWRVPAYDMPPTRQVEDVES